MIDRPFRPIRFVSSVTTGHWGRRLERTTPCRPTPHSSSAPRVRLNRAAAIAERDGAEAGVAATDAVAGLEAYPFWHASRAEPLARLGCTDEARSVWDRALDLGLPRPNARWVQGRMATLDE